MFELIQYAPQTPTVREQPLLIVPPMVNKYYLVDLAPERSMVEYLVRQGQQVFALSWRNPDAEQRDWGLDTYADGALEAIDAVRAITGAERVHLAGNCSGGALVSMLAARAAARGGLDAIGSIMPGVSRARLRARRHRERVHGTGGRQAGGRGRRPQGLPRRRARCRRSSPGCARTT